MRLVSWSLLSCLLASASPAFAGLATAYSDASDFYVENDVLKIAVSRSLGSPDGIIHKQSGVNLQSNAINNSKNMWFLRVNTPTGTVGLQSGNAASFSGSVSTTPTGASLTITWKGQRFLTGSAAVLSGVTVEAQISVRSDSQLSYWTIQATGLGTNSVSSISFPVVTGIGKLGQSGDDDALLVPTLKGVLYHNPTVNLAASSSYGLYPSGNSIQLLSYL